MGKNKRGKKSKIRKRIRKEAPKIKLKKQKTSIISRGKKQTKGDGLFQPFFKAYENFKKKRKLKVLNKSSLGAEKEKDKLKKNKRN